MNSQPTPSEDIVDACPDAAEAKDGKKKSKDELLSFSRPLPPISTDDIGSIFVKIRSMLHATGKTYADSPEFFGEAARESGTHSLKMLSKASKEFTLKIPPAHRGNQPFRLFPLMNPTRSPYAKIIYQPIAIDGQEVSKSLIDHIRYPDLNSEAVLASFASTYSMESLQAIQDGILSDRKYVSCLNAGDFPIVYVPGPDGQDIQLTPISPIETYQGFKNEVGFEDEGRPMVPISHQFVSSQMQIISSAIGGERRRFRANFPTQMSASEAGVFRYAKGGYMPRMPGEEITDLLDSLVELCEKRLRHIDNGAFFNAAMKNHAERLSGWIISEAIGWISEMNDRARRLDPEFDEPEPDVEGLLIRSYRKSGDDLSRVRRAIEDILFTSVLAAEAK